MDKSQQILKIARDRLGNQPTYNPVEFLEMCAVVRDEIEAAEHSVQRTPEQLDRLHEQLDEIIEVGTGGE